MDASSTIEFRRRFGRDPLVRVRAPGRVNLLGEHTDYTGGLVLPLAIDLGLDALASPRADGVMGLEAPRMGKSARLRIDGVPPVHKEPWLNYILGVVAELWPHAGKTLERGFDLLIDGDLPAGAGLASSAAVTVGTAYALSALADLRIADIDLVRAAQRAEHRYVGVQCGIMDQAASALAVRDHVLFLDCRTLEMRSVPLAMRGLVAAVCHTGVQHSLRESGYNQRVAECAEALALLRRERPALGCLGELRPSDGTAARSILPETLARRVEHIVFENERVREATKCLDRGDLRAFGRLMFESHESLRDRYEVSCPELDALFEAARSQEDAVIGAKMTGAGFGGAVVCLVREERALAFQERLRGRAPTVALCRSADGARASLCTRRSP